MNRVIRNVGAGPVVMPSTGQVVLPGTWYVLPESDELTQMLLASVLVDKTDEISSESDPEAYAAKKQATVLDEIESSQSQSNGVTEDATNMSDGAADAPGNGEE